MKIHIFSNLNVVFRNRSRALLILQSDPRKAENFDAQFKSIPVALTPLSRDSRNILDNMMTTKDQFADFDFVNPVYKNYD